LVKFGGSCTSRCWYILWPFGLFRGYCVYITAIWYIFPRFGILYQGITGDPGQQVFQIIEKRSFEKISPQQVNLSTMPWKGRKSVLRFFVEVRNVEGPNSNCRLDSVCMVQRKLVQRQLVQRQVVQRQVVQYCKCGKSYNGSSSHELGRTTAARTMASRLMNRTSFVRTLI
jgi:hypothetical protein